MALTAKVIIDYQNIHLTAHGIFVPNGIPRHESLIHPLHFANQWLSVRNATLQARSASQSQPAVLYELSAVAVYRGNPSNKENPKAYQRNQAQKSHWTRDRRVSVHYRTLQYTWHEGIRLPREKGVDVMVALDLVRSADRHEADVVVLASHDTDMEPALAAAIENTDCVVETVGWDGCRILRVPGRQLWHTTLRGEHFVRSRDREDYA